MIGEREKNLIDYRIDHAQLLPLGCCSYVLCMNDLCGDIHNASTQKFFVFPCSNKENILWKTTIKELYLCQ